MLQFLKHSSNLCTRALRGVSSMKLENPLNLHQSLQTCMNNTGASTAAAARSMGTKAMLKTNKSAAKRIRVRGSGSVKRSKGGFSHNTGFKTRQRSNRTGQSTGIKEPAIEKRMRRLIGK